MIRSDSEPTISAAIKHDSADDATSSARHESVPVYTPGHARSMPLRMERSSTDSEAMFVETAIAERDVVQHPASRTKSHRAMVCPEATEPASASVAALPTCHGGVVLPAPSPVAVENGKDNGAMADIPVVASHDAEPNTYISTLSTPRPPSSVYSQQSMEPPPIPPKNSRRGLTTHRAVIIDEAVHEPGEESTPVSQQLLVPGSALHSSSATPSDSGDSVSTSVRQWSHFSLEEELKRLNMARSSARPDSATLPIMMDKIM